MSWFRFRSYVSVAARKSKALKEVDRRRKKGQPISPVEISGKLIASTFWGKSWCENLESYSDFENRLPRGRTYLRNGSIIDLQIAAGKVTALVCGSELYDVTVEIARLPKDQWQATKRKCSGQIGSLVELLQGRLSKGVMDIATARDTGLFPKPGEIKMRCSCPDWAGMCKHIAATMYGIGARLDSQPELLFRLRQVDHLELIEAPVPSAIAARPKTRGKKTLAVGDIAGVFGIELSDASAPQATVKPAAKATKRTPIKAKAVVANKATQRAKVLAKKVAVAGKTVKRATQPKANVARIRRAAQLRRRSTLPSDLATTSIALPAVRPIAEE